MLEALQKEIEGAMQDPAVIAFALLYKAFKPTVLKQLGLADGQQQALPQQAQHHSMPEQQSVMPQMPIQPQAPTQQPKK